EHALVDRLGKGRDRKVGVGLEPVDQTAQLAAFEARPLAATGIVVGRTRFAPHPDQRRHRRLQPAGHQGHHALGRISAGAAEYGAIGEADLNRGATCEARTATDAYAVRLCRAATDLDPLAAIGTSEAVDERRG